VRFEVVGEIERVETVAEGRGIRELQRLRDAFGGRNWKKKKGQATIQLANGVLRRVEVHWYEAHGVGRRKVKIKRYLDES